MSDSDHSNLHLLTLLGSLCGGVRAGTANLYRKIESPLAWRDTTSQQPVDLRESLAILWSRKWLVLFAAILCTGVALGISYSRSEIYSSRARVLVEPLQLTPDSAPAEPNLQTESELIRSTSVASLVASELGLDEPPASLLAGLSVQPVPDSEVIEVGYSASSPERAARLANGFAQAYITYQQEQVLERILGAQESIRDRIDNVERQLTTVNAEIDDASKRGDEDERSVFQGERASLLARLGILQQELEDLQPDRAIALGGGRIIQPAGESLHPSSPNHRNDAIFGLLIGLITGIGAAFLRHRLDDRLRSRGDFETAIGAPVLAAIPHFKVARKDRASAIPLIADPYGAASESYRSLRINVEALAHRSGFKSLLISSAGAGEGKTTTAVNLAVGLAQIGARTVLLSADLRRPAIESFFNIPAEGQGLSQWLTNSGALSIENLTWGPSVANLLVIPSGPLVANPAELLSSVRMTKLIGALEENFDFVIVDSAPILPVADATVLASRIPQALLVMDSRRADRDTEQNAVRELAQVGCDVTGIVVNGIARPGTGYHPYKQPGYGYQPSLNGGNGVASGDKLRLLRGRAGAR